MNIKKEKWYICWKALRQRCNNPNATNYKWYGALGIKALITKAEVYILWLRDKGYLMKRPSIDRIDKSKHYTFDNCRFIELSENVIRGNKNRGRRIIQKDLDNKILKIWNKITDASKFYNISHCSISDVLSGRTKTSAGFKWEYLDDKLYTNS